MGASRAPRPAPLSMTRRTEQRAAIRAAFEEAGHPLGIQEILEAAQARVPDIGTATVYRNVKALVEAGWLEQVELPGAPPRYERAGQKHHHHFRCDACGRVLDVPGCSARIEKSAPDGFRIDRHEVWLYGLCPDCS